MVNQPRTFGFLVSGQVHYMGERGLSLGEKLPVVGSIVLAALFLAAFVLSESVQDVALAVLHWFESLGTAGVVLYFILYVAVVLFIIPGIVLTLGAGLVFGFWLGGAVVLAALVTGASLAFLIARYALGEGLSQRVREYPRLRVLNRGMHQEGWKIVLLSRLLPVFPFKLSNYFFGLTAIPFRHFFIANLLGVLPLSLTNVYIGSLTGELAELTRRDRHPGEWIFYTIGFFAAIGLIYYISRLARRTMRNAGRMEEEKNRDAGDPAGSPSNAPRGRG